MTKAERLGERTEEAGVLFCRGDGWFGVGLPPKPSRLPPEYPPFAPHLPPFYHPFTTRFLRGQINVTYCEKMRWGDFFRDGRQIV